LDSMTGFDNHAVVLGTAASTTCCASGTVRRHTIEIGQVLKSA